LPVRRLVRHSFSDGGSLGAGATPTRWIEAASPQRVGVNTFHLQTHDLG
jgi:hypothetical protein